MYKYGLTIKYVCKEESTVSDLESAMVVLQLKQKFDVLWTTYERDSKGVIHTHSLIESKKKILVKLMNLKGYTVCCRPILFEQGWYNYAHKEVMHIKNYNFVDVSDGGKPQA